MIDKKQISKDITRLALPVVMENVLQILANVITAAMIGRLISTDISAQGISQRITQIYWALFRGLGMGVTVAVAVSYGAGKLGRCRRIAEQTYLTIMPVALIFTAITLLFPRQLLSIFTSDNVILTRGVQYMLIAVWAIPFTVLTTINTSAFNGQGNTKTPMYIAVILNLINVAVGYAFIFGKLGCPKLGVIGAAIAYVVSQASGGLLGLWLLYKPSGFFASCAHGENFFKIDMTCVKEVVTIGMPAACENLFWQFSAVILSRVILSYGSDSYAAYQLGLQAEMLCEMPSIGLLTTATTLGAKAIGKRDQPLFEAYYKQLLKVCTVLAVFGFCALFFFPGFFMSLLTDNPVLRDIGVKYVFIMSFAQPPQILSKVFTGMTRAAGYKNIPMFVSFIGIWCVRVPMALICAWLLHLDITFIWWAITVDQITRILISIGIFKKKDIVNTIHRLKEQEA
ncbi:MAG: MATE family efflux transporter [Clostridiaceae bacterium]|nr:MATE family efflux transporter [Clostridiaceae bacterium]